MHKLHPQHMDDCGCLECKVKTLDRRFVSQFVQTTKKRRQAEPKKAPFTPGQYPLFHATLTIEECIDQLHRRAQGEKIGNIGQSLLTSILYFLRNPGEISCKKKPKS